MLRYLKYSGVVSGIPGIQVLLVLGYTRCSGTQLGQIYEPYFDATYFQKPLFNRCLPKITFPKVVLIVAEEEKESNQNGTLTASLSGAGNNITESLDNLDPTFVDYER